MSSLCQMLSIKKRNILYYGASVTVQRDGFRPALHDIICRETGHHHDAIVNGIGGVGSMFCAGNLNFVLNKEDKVDLVVHECFTGDTNAGITSVELLPFFLENFCQVFNSCEIVFVLNYRADRAYEDLSDIAKIYHDIASKFGALVISIYEDFHADDFDGLTQNEAYRDGVHPTPAGASVIAKKIWEALNRTQCRNLIDLESFGCYEIHHSKVKFLGFNELIERSQQIFSKGDFIYKNTGQKFSYLEFENDFNIYFEDKKILGFLALSDPRSPLFVNVKLDSNVRKFRTFDRNSFYTRPQTYAWPNLVKASNFNLEFLPDEPDFSTCSKQSDDFNLSRVFKLCGVYYVD